MTRHPVERAFAGTVRDLVMGALGGGGKTSPGEAAEIRRLLETLENKTSHEDPD